MPKPEHLQPVAFLDLSRELRRGDLDAAVEKAMRALRRHQKDGVGEDSADSDKIVTE